MVFFIKVVPINHEDDVEDAEEYTDTDLGAVEEHKSIILHLLSQLKLGMDLTKVILVVYKYPLIKYALRLWYFVAQFNIYTTSYVNFLSNL